MLFDSDQAEGTIQGEPEGFRESVLTSLIKQHIGNNTDLVCFLLAFLQKIHLFSLIWDLLCLRTLNAFM